jgi:tetratricopeptide (TPR) repeat protein
LALVLCFGGPHSAFSQTAPQPSTDPLAAGKQALQHEQWDAAHTFFTGYLHDNPGNAEAEFDLGFASFGMKHYDEAESLFKEIIAQHPKTWAAHSNLAEVYAAEKKWPEFNQERTLLHDAKENREPGTDRIGNDVIELLFVGDERWIVREYYPLSGRFHTRYNFTHFGNDGKLDRYISCESDDVDQAAYAKRHPKKAAAGERSFSLDGYTSNTHSTILFYSEGEPPYERVRADVLRVLTGKEQPGNTIEVNGLEVPQQPDVPKQSPAAPK